MNFRQYLGLIQKSIQLKSVNDLLKLLPFVEVKQTLSNDILQQFHDLPEVCLLKLINKDYRKSIDYLTKLLDESIHEFASTLACYFQFVIKNDFDSLFKVFQYVTNM
jgi:hypothetical protein